MNEVQIIVLYNVEMPPVHLSNAYSNLGIILIQEISLSCLPKGDLLSKLCQFD
jgi:hypothetical protein